MLYRPNTLWTWIFFVSTFIEAVVLITLEVVIYTSLQNSVTPIASTVTAYRSIPSFFALVTLGLVYQLLLVYDTLAHQNTIQVIGLGIYSGALSVYNGIQYNQLRDIVEILTANSVVPQNTWPLLRGMIVSIIVITASFTFWIQYSAWKLYEEFAWVTLRKVEADLQMRRRYLCFQLLLSVLKFDGFFFLGFLLQLAIIPYNKSGPTFVAIVTLIPLSCCLLFITAWVVRHEYRVGTIVISLDQVFHLALIGFFIYMFTAFYLPRTYVEYLSAQRTLSFFGIITIVLALGTVTMICVCFRNFGQGLRPYVSGGAKARLLGETFEMQLREGYLRVPHEAT
ncbi:hypothetical protein BDV27DRAFT_148389 [Aspergillus caelatus]|uniref:Uncharacterized protein n=2 Tax=Aspergillus subgen. Circumdati TaxID=2720871 RepID=A0A5N6ZT99_9EURO|nr:uncharacterized protein BDV27DRAFT_148389 [Aspergillus caelatus]KAE8360777.1 hypothetical protein BDV27DRAFT_148389 [Aspergillus caelatus]KAE8417527.1 hypothetical protein BDV36DRAFT_309432 [Aspergillus pseudocaelatus]